MEEEILTPQVANGEKTRKRKFDPEKMWAKCEACKEPGNLENMLWQKKPFKDQEGKEIFGAFEGVYFCGESCQGLFKG